MNVRQKVAIKMFQYLERHINCENVVNFIKNLQIKGMIKIGKRKLFEFVVGSTPILLEIIKYYSSKKYNLPNKNNLPDVRWLWKQYEIFDFINEANYTGFEYFPYLYGILECPKENVSRLFIFYEHFEGHLTHLFDRMEHPSEWYDIIFQLSIIEHFVSTINHYQYDGKLDNYLYKKLTKPIYQKYVIENYNFNINHKFLIVLWNYDSLEKTEKSKSNVKTIKLLAKYIEENILKISVTHRIKSLLDELQKDSNNILSILDKYYNTQTNK